MPPAVGDAVVVQGLPACQGFNGRRSCGALQPGGLNCWVVHEFGAFFFGGFEGDKSALRFQLCGSGDHEFKPLCSSVQVAGEQMFILPNMTHVYIYIYTYIHIHTYHTHDWF